MNTKAKMTTAEARKWLLEQKRQWVTDQALGVVCFEFPRCDEPCDECWYQAQLAINRLMREVGEQTKPN